MIVNFLVFCIVDLLYIYSTPITFYYKLIILSVLIKDVSRPTAMIILDETFVGFFTFLGQFFFVANDMELNYYHQKVNVLLAS